MKFRIESDALGVKKVPAQAMYGIHTQRARENFEISGRTLPIELFHAIAEIKIACAQANMELRYLDKTRGNAIVKACKEILRGEWDNHFVIDAYQAGAGTPAHMNVNEVIANRAIELLGGSKGHYSVVHPNDDVNIGQSTNDVIPTAIRIVAIKRLHILLLQLERLKKSLMKKSNEFRSLLKSGRTHLQDAVPITLGQEFHAYATSINENIKRVKETIDFLRSLNIGKNAIGTGINTLHNYTKKILKYLKKINKFNWKEARDPIHATQSVTELVEVSYHLKLLAIDLTKICNDLRLLASGPNTGLMEIRLPAVEPGSSIMPGKVNPSMAEMLNMVCYQVMGNDEAISLAGQAGQLELNVNLPLIANNLIESIDLLSNGIKAFDAKCVQGIKANEEICWYYFEHSAGLGTLLLPYIGYDKAAAVVQESLRTGEKISEVVLKRRLMKESDLVKLLDYRKVTGPNLKRR